MEGFVIRNICSLQRTEHKYIIHLDEYKPDLVATPEKPLSLRATYGPLVDTPQFQLLYEAEVMGRSLKEIARDLGISEDACVYTVLSVQRLTLSQALDYALYERGGICCVINCKA